MCLSRADSKKMKLTSASSSCLEFLGHWLVALSEEGEGVSV